MTAFTYSISAGKGPSELAPQHDTDPQYRAKLKNVDPALIKYDKVLISQPGNPAKQLQTFYDKRFGDAVNKYNEHQEETGHSERIIQNYYEKVMGEYNRDNDAYLSGKKSRRQKTPPAVEYVIAFGDGDEHPDRETTDAIYTEFVERFQEKYPGMEVVWASIHNDEPGAATHLQMAICPCGHSTRGLSEQVGWNIALKRCGISKKQDFLNSMYRDLEDLAAEHGLELSERMENGRKRTTTRQFKEGVADLEREQEKTAKLAAQLKDAEDQRDKYADQIADMEPVYREHKNDKPTTTPEASDDVEEATQRLEYVTSQIITLQGRQRDLQRYIDEARERQRKQFEQAGGLTDDEILANAHSAYFKSHPSRARADAEAKATAETKRQQQQQPPAAPKPQQQTAPQPQPKPQSDTVQFTFSKAYLESPDYHLILGGGVKKGGTDLLYYGQPGYMLKADSKHFDGHTLKVNTRPGNVLTHCLMDTRDGQIAIARTDRLTASEITTARLEGVNSDALKGRGQRYVSRTASRETGPSSNVVDALSDQVNAQITQIGDRDLGLGR